MYNEELLGLRRHMTRLERTQGNHIKTLNFFILYSFAAILSPVTPTFCKTFQTSNPLSSPSSSPNSTVPFGVNLLKCSGCSVPQSICSPLMNRANLSWNACLTSFFSLRVKSSPFPQNQIAISVPCVTPHCFGTDLSTHFARHSMRYLYTKPPAPCRTSALTNPRSSAWIWISA